MAVFVARQPIFDRDRRVFAYELILRTGITGLPQLASPGEEPEGERCGLLLPGLYAVTRGKTALVNMTRDVLKAASDDADRAVKHLHEASDLVPDVVQACRQLKIAGCLLALDVSVDVGQHQELAKLADFVSVDIGRIQSVGIERLAWWLDRGARLLATGVETADDYETALRSGFTHFQGEHFIRPVILAGEDIPGFKLHYLAILREVHRPDLDFQRLEDLLKQEMSLSYKFLRYINSAYFGFRDQIRSIRHAMVLLGEREIRRWVSMSAMWIMGGDRPEETVIQATTRARFCELIARPAGLEDRSQELFLMGMWSLLDAIIGRPLPELLRTIPMAADIEAALLGEKGGLRNIFECVIAYERGDWPRLSRQAKRLGVDESAIPALYVSAVDWVQQVFLARSNAA